MADPVNKVQNIGKDVLNNATKAYNAVLDGKSNVIVISFIIIFFILFALLSWIFNILSLQDKSCDNLNKIYPTNNVYKTKSFLNSNGVVISEAKADFDNSLNSILKNYYVKTAYNCCCGDGYKNNFVNKCALEKCIVQGARCLDFEIYSYNGEPIVAASTANNNSIKETYNYLKLDEVFEILYNQSFEHNNDPMFLHFRIMSDNKIIYDKMANYIKTHLAKNRDYLYPHVLNMGVNYDENKIFTKHLKDFNKKFIIMVNSKTPSLIDNSELKKYVNLKSGTNKTMLYRFSDIDANSKRLMAEESKNRLIIVLPNISNRLENYDSATVTSSGCQFIGMKFQNMDTNLYAYNKIFKDEGGFSFILKAPKLRSPLGENPDYSEQITLEPVGIGNLWQSI